MLVHVTKKHIKKGKRKAIASCPVALALREVGYRRATVASYVLLDGKDSCADRLFRPSIRVARLINRFDDGKQIEPFSFLVPEMECGHQTKHT
jgi:hypothetical protein